MAVLRQIVSYFFCFFFLNVLLWIKVKHRPAVAGVCRHLPGDGAIDDIICPACSRNLRPVWAPPELVTSTGAWLTPGTLVLVLTGFIMSGFRCCFRRCDTSGIRSADSACGEALRRPRWRKPASCWHPSSSLMFLWVNGGVRVRDWPGRFPWITLRV